LRRWVQAPRKSCPEKHCGHRAPSAGSGLAEARAEECGDGPGPPRAVPALDKRRGWGRAIRHESLR
jgi:hypothetical protein